MPERAPTALARTTAEVERLMFPVPDGGVPNNPDLPVLLIRGAVTGTADEIMALHEVNGWRRVWTWSVFDYHHYHPNAHEALTVAEGSVRLQIGGPSGPILTLAAGDAVILPAGTGHCRISASQDFAICGSYPPDQADRVITHAGDMPIDVAQAQVAAVALPSTDPIFGADGPTVRHWKRDRPHGP